MRSPGRYAATVTPKIIRRGENRVDLVFEVVEGKMVEVERLSFVGNRNFSDRRLRGVLGTKQAGLLRQFIQRDTYVPERHGVRQARAARFLHVARLSSTSSVAQRDAPAARNRNAFFLTFNVDGGPAVPTSARSSVATDVPGIDRAGPTASW